MRLFVSMCLMLLSVGILFGQTTVSGGLINKDSTWTLARSPYTVTGNLTIQGGFTLRVDSGVTVRFGSGVALYATYGHLQARHTLFTSVKDTVGGSPARGDWAGIQIGEYNFNSSSVIDTSQIRYAGTVASAAIYLRSGSLAMRSSIVTNSSNQGIVAYAGTLTLAQTQITNVNTNGLLVQGGAAVTMRDGLVGQTDWPIVMNGVASLSFSGNPSFPGNKRNGILLNFGSMGSDLVLDTVAIPYVTTTSGLTVNAGSTLTIAAGNVVKVQGGSIIVRGALRAVGGPTDRINFTSYRDDNLPTPGSDTNNDGTATAPAASNWGGVEFYAESVDSLSLMRRCVVQFGGSGSIGAISMYDANPTIDSCEMKNSYYGAMMQYASKPVFSNNIIGSSTRVPIAMSFAAYPVFLNNSFSFSDNQYDAIGLLGGTLTADAILPIRSVTSIPNVTYLMLESVTVPPGRLMTINKGVVLKAEQYSHRIVIQGKLVANATPDSMIVFTSAKDDNYGNPGDTNKDGTQSVPNKGDWSGFVFEAGSDTTSIINNCKIFFASLSSSYYNTRYISGGAVTTVNAHPTISNCVIKDVNYAIYAFQASNPKVVNDTIANTTYTPIAMSVSANPVMSGLTFVNVRWRALGLIGENLGASGTVVQRSVGGYSNISYVLLEDLSINSGTTVAVQPGVVVKMNSGVGISVNGVLQARGSIANGEVIVTSLKDDNFGNPGDTNGDGNSTSPARGDWNTIRFMPTSDDIQCVLDSVLIKYAGSSNYGSVTYTDAGSTLSHSTLSDGNGYGVSCEGSSTPVLNTVTIQNCRLDPIAMSLKSNPTFTNITFAANGSRGIWILEGTLSSDATLNKRDVAGINNIAYIMNNLTISPSAVLTIAPGVVVKFAGSYSMITVQGALVAKGTTAEKIIFTSIADDSRGGDTNNDANGSSPARGNWGSIDFNASSADSLNVLRNCEFRYGGGGYVTYYYQYGVVRAFNARTVVDSCSIQQSASSALGSFGSANPVLSNCEISNVSSVPVAMSMFSNPTFVNNVAYNIGYMALGIVPENYSVSATIPVRDFAGYSNITYYFFGTSTVNTGTVITIPAGIVIKNGNITVNGGLKILGTQAQPVVFTHERDDASGNPLDSNGDGSTTSPTINSAQAVYFADVSMDTASVVQNAVFRYRTYGIYLDQASPTIRSSRFDRDQWGIVLNGVSNPVVDSCQFVNLTYAPLYLSLVSYPASSVGNQLSGSTYRAIGVINNETLVQDVTLPKRNFAGVTNIPYFFQSYTVATNAVLTIDPGVVLKFGPGTGLTVRKGLIAEGGSTPDSTIVFTDIRDDFYGGDTNADSTISKPTDYYSGWYGIVFAGESLDPLCRLRYTVFRHVGYSNGTGAIMPQDASPTITYSSIANCQNGIVASGASNPVVNYCDIYNIGNLGFNNVNKSFNIDARWNWWGSNSGPTVASNPGGTGSAVTTSVNYAPFLGSGASNPVAGDVSLNGAVQAFDASLVLKYVVDPVGNPFNALQTKVADVSGTAGITSFDASLILQWVVGRISGFPVEANIRDGAEQTKLKQMLAKGAAVRSLMLHGGTAKRGERFTMALAAEGLSDVYGADMTFSFDPSTMKPVEVRTAGKTADASLASFVDENALRVALAAPAAIGGDGTLLEIVFEISKDVRGETESPVQLTQFMLNESKTAVTTAGSVMVIGKPLSFGLDQNYPNPFNPTTTIAYRVPEDGSLVKIEVYNLMGQRVRTLVNGMHDAGEFRAVWDATNDSGVKVGSGMYIYRISSDAFSAVRKMVLLK